ncbi:hypothetical protein [Candidatus Tisiphia endosymbiont of Oplodontha viridula]|uniref:hypothetical protein n=1 Tax=Candidatus Tisiphia endosymbiont of Oplodontha viridula TaxID=3077925 RepID=UPI0035C8FD1D
MNIFKIIPPVFCCGFLESQLTAIIFLKKLNIFYLYFISVQDKEIKERIKNSR